ncbi:MAG: fluoride efflux transporter CrcB [Aestuariivirgaceae bacterium]
MPLILWVAAGGAVGASGRDLMNVYAGRFLGTDFPWGTFIVNVAGSFLMGMFIIAMALKFQTSLEMRAFLTTGILGGFTTFSAFSLDFVTLFERKQHGLAVLYAASSVGLALVAIFAGMALMRALLS